jgi:hypothetical protein
MVGWFNCSRACGEAEHHGRRGPTASQRVTGTREEDGDELHPSKAPPPVSHFLLPTVVSSINQWIHPVTSQRPQL